LDDAFDRLTKQQIHQQIERLNGPSQVVCDQCGELLAHPFDIAPAGQK
jgi:hypothetical protein